VLVPIEEWRRLQKAAPPSLKDCLLRRSRDLKIEFGESGGSGAREIEIWIESLERTHQVLSMNAACCREWAV
jgi:hypothetical protein